MSSDIQTNSPKKVLILVGGVVKKRSRHERKRRSIKAYQYAGKTDVRHYYESINQHLLLNQQFNQLKVEKHPDKTFIGRIEKGFNFLGYHSSRKRLRVAKETIRRELLSKVVFPHLS